MQEEKIANLAGLIVYTDWYYAYSDSYSVYLKGEARVKEVYQEFREENPSDLDIEKIKQQILKILEPRFQNTPNKESLIKCSNSYAETLDKVIKKIRTQNARSN